MTGEAARRRSDFARLKSLCDRMPKDAQRELLNEEPKETRFEDWIVTPRRAFVLLALTLKRKGAPLGHSLRLDLRGRYLMGRLLIGWEYKEPTECVVVAL